MHRYSHSLLITLGYLVIAGAWVLGSDQLLAFIVGDPGPLTRLQQLKGGLFVLFTAGVLYTLLSASARSQARTAAAVRGQAAYYRTLFEENHAAMLLVDPHTSSIIDANGAACRFYGYSRAALQRLTLAEINVFSTEEVHQEMEQAHTQARHFFRFRHRIAGGAIRDVEVYSGPVELGGRELLASIIHDVTERVRIQTQLASIIESVFDAVICADEGGEVVLFNAAAARLFACPAGQAQGRPLAHFISAPLPDAATPPPDTLTTVTVQRADGSCFPAEVSLTSARIGGHTITTAIMRDISVRLEHERERETLLAVASALNEQTSRRLRRLVALRRVDIAISAGQDRPSVFATILQEVMEQLEVDAAAILLLDAQAQLLELAAERGLRNAYPSLRVQLGEGLAGSAALIRQRIAVGTGAEQATAPLSPLLADEGIVQGYAVPLLVEGQVVGVLDVFLRTRREVDEEWFDFLDALAGQAAIAINSAALVAGLQQANVMLIAAYDATLAGWARALELRDKETEGHSRRVTTMTVRLARALGVAEQELEHIRRGALLHDIGKMGVPDAILHKPGPLSDEERALMQQHPIYAEEWLAPIPFLQPALAIPASHHERWDGSGYPHGLAGEQIPLAARIFAVVDVWDALMSDRPYRAAWPPEQVRDYLLQQAGTHFDPQVVATFLQLLDKDKR